MIFWKNSPNWCVTLVTAERMFKQIWKTRQCDKWRADVIGTGRWHSVPGRRITAAASKYRLSTVSFSNFKLPPFEKKSSSTLPPGGKWKSWTSAFRPNWNLIEQSRKTQYQSRSVGKNNETLRCFLFDEPPLWELHKGRRRQRTFLSAWQRCNNQIAFKLNLILRLKLMRTFLKI